ncbi:hypothetical protein CcCBS67573_g04378 [Chytriomyces confervae]|uniref:Protein YIP n=1 Tax=Chytriomyces confervae TaxID=246404 RepID=A0A507FDL6_9FUNG|nr:hypothetical protein HDU80_006994 [Chytriomyces hyalinus]TPX74343.1 hypothetical protein CcCBS67573_g04378 [Chytriomyces confervae]
MSKSTNYEALLDLDDPQLDTAQSQLEFQNFVLNSAEQNLVSGNVGSSSGQRASSNSAAPAPSQTKASPAFAQPQQPMTNNTSTSAFWTIEFYARFFDVDSSDVAQRIIAALIPRDSFMDKISANPDLYGPFWIPTTVIFSLFISSFIAGSINSYLSDSSKEYVYDMTLLSFASTVVYSYVGITAGLIWAIGKYFACPVKILEVMGLVGYGMSIWVPVSVLCAIPSAFLRSILVLAGFALTSYLFITNINPFFNEPSRAAAKTIVLTAIVVLNAAIALAFRYGFFAFVAETSGGVGRGEDVPVKSGAAV